MKPLWIIIQEAVYRHKIIGIFNSKEKALKKFDELWNIYKTETKLSYWHDFDGHHEYILYNIDYAEEIPKDAIGENINYEVIEGGQ